MKSGILFITLIFLLQGSEKTERPILEDTGNISLELIKEKIIIPVQIGDKTYKFLVDTGGIFEISEALQNEFQFNQTESTTIVGINRKEIENEQPRGRAVGVSK